MTTIKLTNTITHKKEIFKPISPDHVGLYLCGPTVYDRPHIGNARSAIVFDVLYRLLKKSFPKVTYVRNVTDVDDKINIRSKELGIPIRELTETTLGCYHEDVGALGALPPDIEPRATEHIAEMITMSEALIQKGHAYAADGHVLFDVTSYGNYGKLSRKNQDDLIAGARIEIAPYKRNASDFVLWKPSDDETPGWDSPWGRGRPGWHIECSAMSAKYLGETFDIHGGGVDLVFPHHENEVAQSCCAHGTERMARTWLHNGHLTVNGEKMSKSLGNFVTVQDLLGDHDGEVIRLALLLTHYHQPLDWTDQQLVSAKQMLDRFYGALDLVIEPLDAEAEPAGVIDALADDLNTPQALAILHELANQLYKSPSVALASQFKNGAALLGILQRSPKEWFQGKAGADELDIEMLIQQRNDAKKAKNFAAADQIRADLLAKGVILLDTGAGTTWRLA
ncbi:MAG: cysteine--tRNA ligase [Pseudomonadota bacterium]|nr:cysteine--tRNA ligase [Alphaproteobacteria bacterium]MDP5370395.1 cysteine--tRNA ligase [Pseudomonadota bacterium]